MNVQTLRNKLNPDQPHQLTAPDIWLLTDLTEDSTLVDGFLAQIHCLPCVPTNEVAREKNACVHSESHRQDRTCCCECSFMYLVKCDHPPSGCRKCKFCYPSDGFNCNFTASTFTGYGVRVAEPHHDGRVLAPAVLHAQKRPPHAHCAAA